MKEADGAEVMRCERRRLGEDREGSKCRGGPERAGKAERAERSKAERAGKKSWRQSEKKEQRRDEDGWSQKEEGCDGRRKR